MSEMNLYSQSYSAPGMNMSDVPVASLPGVTPRAPQPCGAQSIASLPERKAHSSSEVLAAHFVRKSYRKGPFAVPVLQGIELAVTKGEFVSIIGPSGCGKTTLLHLLA